MKQLIVLILLFFCASCASYTPRFEPYYGTISEVNYNNHNYIVFRTPEGSSAVHDPNCECMVDYE